MKASPYPISSERQARSTIVELSRRLVEEGLNHSASGNVSLRWHRSRLAGMLVTPSAVDASQLEEDDIVWVSLPDEGPHGPVIDGPLKPSSEWHIHHDLYRNRPEVGCVIHAHSPMASALSCLPRVQQEGIPPFHYMVAMAGGHDIRCARYATFGTPELSLRVLDALRDRRACLLAHHGQVVCGAHPAQALALAIEVESLCVQWHACLAAGGAALLDEHEMERVVQRFAGYRPSGSA